MSFVQIVIEIYITKWEIISNNGVWCNGNTGGFEPFQSMGSNPFTPTNIRGCVRVGELRRSVKIFTLYIISIYLYRNRYMGKKKCKSCGKEFEVDSRTKRKKFKNKRRKNKIREKNNYQIQKNWVLIDHNGK